MFIVGGGPQPRALVEHFVALAGGPGKARIAVLPMASGVESTGPEKAEELRVLRECIASLPEREQLVVALYYYENLTLREIGEVLGVTESRVSQLHTKAVMRLKNHLQ